MNNGQERRIPTQDRSRQRYDDILAAAAKVFSDNGFDAATMKDIAARSGMAIGSVYQYFSDKKAIGRALALRYLDGLQVITEEFVKFDTTGMPTAEAIDHLVDPVVAFHLDNPAFSPMWLGADLSRPLQETMFATDEAMLSRVVDLIQKRLPEMPAPRTRLTAMVLLGAGKGLLAHLVRAEDERAVRRATREVKRMMVEYFESIIREFEPGASDAPESAGR